MVSLPAFRELYRYNDRNLSIFDAGMQASAD